MMLQILLKLLPFRMVCTLLSSVASREFRTRSVLLLSQSGPITDYNEVTLHFIQCVRMHIENTKSKVGSPAHTNSSVGTPFSNRLSEAATPPSVKSNPAPVTSGTNGSETDFYTQVLNVFREPANIESDHGVHVDDIAKRFRLPALKIKEAID
uniref:Replication protein A C-terminal domain-containing protein n=1 Tax=Aegilops tauschii subsp. strangulata TaxID=200361 RepID=A0A453Q6W5_AEGTS